MEVKWIEAARAGGFCVAIGAARGLRIQAVD
jgi:hypothetical protein